jgi:hypothetical protein
MGVALLRKHAASAAALLLLFFFYLVHRQDSRNCTIDCRMSRAIWGTEARRNHLCEPDTCPVIVPRFGHCDGGCKGAGPECMDSAKAVLDGSTWTSLDMTPNDRLNRAIEENIRRQGLRGEGSVAQNPLQRRVYTALASLPCVKTICEVGFNHGHSAGLWLLANPTADVYFFDLFQWTGAVEGEKFLREHGQEHGIKNVSRLMPITKGDSGTCAACDACETCAVLSVLGRAVAAASGDAGVSLQYLPPDPMLSVHARA